MHEELGTIGNPTPQLVTQGIQGDHFPQTFDQRLGEYTNKPAQQHPENSSGNSLQQISQELPAQNTRSSFGALPSPNHICGNLCRKLSISTAK